MKINKIMAVFAAALLFSGCSGRGSVLDDQSGGSGDPGSPSPSFSSVADPMKVPSGNEGQKIPSLGYIFNADFSAEDGKLIFSPTLTGTGSDTRIGIMVFVDGILQKYSVDNSSENGYMSIFEIKGKSEEKYKLYLDTEVDETRSEHIISYVTMLAPDYVPPEETPRFGFYHRSLHHNSVTAPDGLIPAVSETPNVLKADNAVFTQKQLEFYQLENEDEMSGYTFGFGLLQSDELYETSYKLDPGSNELELKFYAYTTEKAVHDYRITFFKNHEPVKFNGGYEYLDFTLEGNKITECKISIPDVKPGDFIYYIAAPLEANAACNKSEPKMVLSADGTYGGNRDAAQGNSQSSDQSNIQSLSPSNAELKNTVVFDERISVVSSIGDFIYVMRDSELLKINSSGEIVKTLSNVEDVEIHGDKIAVKENHVYDNIEENGVFAMGISKDPYIILSLYDTDFNKLKSVKITENVKGNTYVFDENIIVYTVDLGKELRCCDWDLKNEKVLMKCRGYISFLTLGDGFAAFRMSGDNGRYCGVCTLDGKSETCRKDDISSEIGTSGGTALWCDAHVNVAGGQLPSGEIILWRNGQFETVKPETRVESQDAFLTAENEFFTAPEDGGVLKQYVNGKKAAELPLERTEYVYSVTRAGDKIFANTALGSEYRLRIWELKR
ncbi:MAG: hypothetical protein K2J77_00930 [Oscillospiraceae bacterium]|nr:hypothetical protein [Oscillospiraceae bacterium]